MMDLFDSLSSVMKKKSFYILLLSLLLISGIRGQGNPVITLSNNPTITHSTLLPGNNTADVTILTLNVTLQASVEGNWQKPDGTHIDGNEIVFDVFTLILAGLYKFFTVENETPTLVIQIQISATGVNMAEFTAEEEYILLSGNDVFYADTTLVCATSEATEPQWTFKAVQTDNYINQSYTSWNSTTGISTLTITTTQQGYYTCTPIAGGITYTVAIFNLDDTLIATVGQSYNYTKGVDPSDIQLLCTDSNTPLSDIQWESSDNPLVLASVENQATTLTCRTVSLSTNILQINLVVQGPPVITLSATPAIEYAKLPNSDDTNRADIFVLSQDIKLQTNLEGRWELPGGSSITGNTANIGLFTVNLAGLYKFYVTSWDGIEVIAIQIELAEIVVNFAELTSQGDYHILSGNEVFNSSTKLVCATSGTSEPSWQYKAVQTDNYITESATSWDSTTGISTLTITTTQQGYYTCTPIAGGITYTVAIFNPDDTVEVTTQGVKVFTRGIDSPQLQLLCISSDANIPLDDIQWTVIVSTSSSIQNPFVVSILRNGYHQLQCNRGSDSSFNYTIIVQGSPTLTINGTSSGSYTLLQQMINTADITVFSQNITLQVNLVTENSLGRWDTPLTTESPISSIVISELTANLAGFYKFYVTNFLGDEDLAIQIQISAIGSNFAELTSSNVYTLLSGNNIFYTNTTPVCVTSGASEPSWHYKAVQTDNYILESSTLWDSTTGISTLTITTTQQGYYTCTPIAGGITYTVAIFNPDDTLEVTTQGLKLFTRGIDSPQLQLLYRSSDSNIPLDELQWTQIIPPSLRLQNPFIVSTLSDGYYYLQCNRGSDTSFIYTIIVQGSPTLTITDTSSMNYTLLSPMDNTADITVFSQNITLQVNLIANNSLGRWDTPLSPEITTQSTTIPEFTANLAGLYKFYVINFLGNEELAIQIQINTVGSNFAELTSSNEYTLLSGNNIFYTDTTLVCVTNDTSIEPTWSYKETQQGRLRRPAGVIWNPFTGISRLDIVITQPGYYTCATTGGSAYIVATFNSDITTIATDGKKYTYTRGVYSTDTQLLCISDSNTALSDIRWGFMDNPLILDSLQNQETTLTCRRKASTSKSILQVEVVVQEQPVITLSTSSHTMTYSDLLTDNNTADIMILSQNVTIRANFSGKWELPDGSSLIGKLIQIELFTRNLAGLYKFYIVGLEGTEILAIQIEITAIVVDFAELTSQGEYNILSGNEVFNTSTTLICATSVASEPSWQYKTVQTDNYITQSSTSWNSTTGISTLTLTITQQGYYTCTPIAGGITYTVAIFNPDDTLEVTTQGVKVFTRGIDSPQLQLLCRSSDSNIPLDDIQWTSLFPTSLSLHNPFIVNTLSDGYHYFQCNRGSVTPFFCTIVMQGPPTLTITDTSNMSYTLLPPMNNTADITVFSQNIKLQVNLITQDSLGRWDTPLNPEITTQSTTIPEFTANLAGLYKLYVINFLGNEELAIQIQINTVGSNFAELTSSNEYTLLSGNNIFYTDTTLVCATNDTSNEPVWSYNETQQGTDSTPPGVIWDPSTGISKLDIITTQQGYYTCAVTGESYTVAIFNPGITTIANDSQEYTYTKDIDPPDTQLLCNTTDSSTPLSEIQWGSLDNPLVLNSTENQDSITTCTVDTSVNLIIQGPPMITLSTTSDTYSELPTSGNANTAYIPVLSQNVILNVNLRGRWVPSDSTTVGGESIEIQLFTINLAGVYQFKVTSWSGSEVLAIQIELSAIGKAIGIEKDSTITPISSNTIRYRNTITLVVASNKTSLESGDAVWSYQESLEGNTSIINETSNDFSRSISKLNLTNMADGYYSVSINDSNSGVGQYIVGIFNDELIHDTSVNKTIRYTSGIDSEELQILCIPPDDNSGLENIRWTNGSQNFSNPVTLERVITELNTTGNINFTCDNTTNDEVYSTIDIMIQDFPIIFLNYAGTKYNTSGIKGKVCFDLDVPVYTQDVQLECNRNQCRWMNNDTPLIFTNMPYEIKHLTINTDGVYMLEILNSSNLFTKSVEIDLRAIGTAFLTVESEGIYKEQENNSIIDMADTIMLACATSNTVTSEDRVSWYFQENIESSPKKEMSELNGTTGLSVLQATKPGYYHCYVKDHGGNMEKYSVGLIELTKDTLLINFTDTEPRNYILGEPFQYYYQDPEIPITAIRWGKGVKEGDEEESELEFLNPVNISEVFNRFGSGAIEFSCFYRKSPAKILGNLSLNIKDNENLTIQYENVSETFGDLSNPDLNTAQNIDIAVVTKNVSLSCSSPLCKVQKGILTSSMEFLEIIDSIKKENEGIYSLRRVTATGNTYTTASIYLNVTGFIQQNITEIFSSEINDTSINISWELQNVLPDNADQIFNITYQKDGGELVLAGVTQGQLFNITGLTACVVYTVSVELSYAYTFEKDIISKEAMIKCPEPPLLIIIIVCIVVVLILILVVIAVILIILCIWKLRGKNDKKFQSLRTDENEPKMKPPVRSSRDFEYAQIPPPIDNLAYNPVLTESLPKFNQSASSSSRNYHNLQEVKDPRMKPIPLNMYKKTIDKLWEDENALENEYRSLGGEILRYECRFAQLDQNRIKNKYKFIYPYDTSRVVLQKVGKDVYSDYINASNIPGTYVGENFIAAQGPKVNTIQDIWRMVFEQKIVNIVMVTNCIEGGKLKCEEYFPPKEGKTNEYAQYKVKTISRSNFEGYITRVLKIQSPTESKQVNHFHFTAWPDHDVPSLHDELLQFIGYVQDNITQSEAPILVHCSAGVGRTGTFITLFNLRAAILKGKPISIYYLVHEMREHRPHMVQTFRQYKFIYLAVLELLLDNTSIPADEFSSTYQNYLQTDQTGYVSVFFQQYSELNYQCEKSFEYSTDNGEDNVEKNPIPDIMPYDNNRVVIYSPYFECGYINASYHENNLFITTQHPTENTLLDFLQMIYQTEANLVVMLTTAKEKAKIQGNISVRKAYWPNKDVPLEVPPFQVEVVNSEKSASMVKQKIILRNLQESSERTFTHVVSTSWTEKNDPTDLSPVLVLQMLLHHRQEYPNSTIIMHCTDSISKTGVMLTVYQCIREMEKTGKVDMFHTVKRLRRERMRFIPNLSQFLACFSLMNEYCSSK